MNKFWPKSPLVEVYRKSSCWDIKTFWPSICLILTISFCILIRNWANDSVESCQKEFDNDVYKQNSRMMTISVKIMMEKDLLLEANNLLILDDIRRYENRIIYY